MIAAKLGVALFGVSLFGVVFGAGLAHAQDGVRDAPRDGAQVGAQACPGNPNALGTSRVLAIDPSEIKRVGRMQYPDSLPLADKEVVLTFDDGPLPPYSNKILDILASECVKATYFLVGSMARAYPAVVRRIYEEGHTIGTHSDNHPLHFGTLPIDRMRQEIDFGIADVGMALGDSKYLAPFFRVPGLERSDTLESELAARSLVVFSSDTVADDWHRGIKPNQIIALALSRLQARGKGILLVHDIHPATVAALPGLLKALKDNGFHIVQVVPSASYLMAMAAKPVRPMFASARPEELHVGDGIDGGTVQPAWPGSTDHLTPDEIALPAPDASAFQPDSGVTENSGNVQWPEQPKNTVSSGKSGGKRSGKKIASHSEPGNDDVHGSRHSRLHRSDRRDAHRHRERADTNVQPNVASRTKFFAAIFSAAPPAPPAH